MNKLNLIVRASIVINAPVARVWQGLTDPALVEQWMFGTKMSVSEWKAGGEIRYRGEWQGKTYEDKGSIIEIIPEQKLVSTFWSSLSGLSDNPENYQTVTYELSEEGSETKVSITQDCSKTEEEAKHSEGNWKQVLEGLKRLLESFPAISSNFK